MQIQVERLALTISIMRHKLDGWQISELSMLYAIDCMLTYEQYYTNVSNYFNRSFNSLSNNAIKILVERYPNLNQSKLAEALGISHQAVNKALKNSTNNLRLQVAGGLKPLLIRLLRVLGCNQILVKI